MYLMAGLTSYFLAIVYEVGPAIMGSMSVVKIKRYLNFIKTISNILILNFNNISETIRESGTFFVGDVVIVYQCNSVVMSILL